MMTTVALPAAAASPARASSPVEAPLGPSMVVDKRADASPALPAAAELEGDENASVNVAGVAVLEPVRAVKKRRRVAFEAADIVEFEPTAFTTTVTSGGIPIGMSLEERSRTRRRLDSFEMERKEHRVGRQSYMEEGYLDPQERETILSGAGCEELTLESVEAEVNQIIADRRESNEMDFEFLYGLGGLDEGDEDEEDEEDEPRGAVAVQGNENDEDEPEDDAEESNQEDDAVAAFLSTSTTLESSSDTDNNTDDDAACP